MTVPETGRLLSRSAAVSSHASSCFRWGLRISQPPLKVKMKKMEFHALKKAEKCAKIDVIISEKCVIAIFHETENPLSIILSGRVSVTDRVAKGLRGTS